MAISHSDKSSHDNLLGIKYLKYLYIKWLILYINYNNILLEALFGFMYLKEVLKLDANHVKAIFNIAIFLREYPTLF